MGLLLFCPESSFFWVYWYCLNIHTVDLDEPAGFNRLKNHANLLLRPLDLHGHGSFPFVSDPSRTSVEIGSVPGSPSKADALDGAMESDMFAGHFSISPVQSMIPPNSYMFL